MGKPKPASPPLAYSYIRFSSPKQAEGDSLRRQTERAAAWCDRSGVRLDTTTTLHDLGTSAYTGKHRSNPDRHALAAFLKLVEQGRVPRGSALIVESLDRLSREDIQPALMLLLNLLQAGVRVVQLIPVEQTYDDKSEAMAIMLAIVELSRGNSESRVKSERIGDAWAAKRTAARTTGEILSARAPAWVEIKAGKFRLIPERARAVRRIFALAASGYGLKLICMKLTADGVSAFGKKGYWVRSYVALILKDRRAVGEYQPCRLTNGKRTPEGDVIPGYFPAAVSEDQWLAGRAGAAERKDSRGRNGSDGFLNVFQGLITSARDGGVYYADQAYDHGQKTNRILRNVRGVEGRAKTFSFPYWSFEGAVLALLREIDPSEILGTDDPPDQSEVKAGELARVESEIAELERELEAGEDIPSVVRVLRKKEKLRSELAREVMELRQKAVNPLSESWGEARTLADVLASAPDQHDARVRLRSALRRVVESIWLLVVPRGITRLAAVQMNFKGGAVRRLLIVHRAAHGRAGSAARWEAHSFTAADELDLGNPAHVKRLLKVLEADLPPGKVTGV